MAGVEQEDSGALMLSASAILETDLFLQRF